MYFVQTKDTESAKLWIRFIVKNKKIPRINFPVIDWFKTYYSMCAVFGGKSTYDDRCAIISSTWGLIYDVWRYLGLDNEKDTPLTALRMMRMGGATDVFPNGLQPTDGSGSYMAILAVDDAWIRKTVGRETAATKYNVKQLAKRTRYRNPYYLYFEDGPNELGARQILEICPDSRPAFGERVPPHYAEIIGQYIWNKVKYINTFYPHGQYNVPSGPDCLVASNLYLGLSPHK
jgi:hypothetical protein